MEHLLQLEKSKHQTHFCFWLSFFIGGMAVINCVSESLNQGTFVYQALWNFYIQSFDPSHLLDDNRPFAIFGTSFLVLFTFVGSFTLSSASSRLPRSAYLDWHMKQLGKQMIGHSDVYESEGKLSYDVQTHQGNFFVSISHQGELLSVRPFQE